MVVGTVSSAGLPPGWQEVHAEGQVYYWCAFVCLFVSARADFFFLEELDYFLFSLSLSFGLLGTFSRRRRDRRNERSFSLSLRFRFDFVKQRRRLERKLC